MDKPDVVSYIPWAQRIWALPFLSVLAPSERYYKARGRKLKKITDRARQLGFQLRRWLPEQAMIFVGDNTSAALDFLSACQTRHDSVAVITRLRLDAAQYDHHLTAAEVVLAKKGGDVSGGACLANTSLGCQVASCFSAMPCRARSAT